MKKSIQIFYFLLFASTILTAQPKQCAIKKDTAVFVISSICSKDTLYIDTASISYDVKQLIIELRNYVAKQNKPESASIGYLDITSKIIGIITAILALIIGIVAFKKKNWFDQIKGVLSILALFFASICLALFFKEILFVIVFTFFAISVILFLFLYISLKYIQHFDKLGYGFTNKFAEAFGIKKDANQ
jgi:hypothetical protein